MRGFPFDRVDPLLLWLSHVIHSSAKHPGGEVHCTIIGAYWLDNCQALWQFLAFSAIDVYHSNRGNPFMDKQSAAAQLRSKAKKLEMLASLLDDGEIASELAGLFAQVDPPAENSAIKKTPQLKTTRPRRTSKRRKRGLEPAAVKMVITAGTPMTAKAVTERLEGVGFAFGSQNHQVAVSKVLRQAAKMGKIAANHNGHDKSPIIYTPIIEGARILPVQGNPN
jgi:hypothetical protein